MMPSRKYKFFCAIEMRGAAQSGGRGEPWQRRGSRRNYCELNVHVLTSEPGEVTGGLKERGTDLASVLERCPTGNAEGRLLGYQIWMQGNQSGGYDMRQERRE